MTTTTAAPEATVDVEPIEPAPNRRGLIPVVSMVLVVVVGSIIPLIRTPNFYFWDDTAGVAVGVWQRIGEQVLQGSLPFLQLDMWRGGNFIAEAATGMWNPVMLALMVGTHPLDDIAVAITISKIVLFVIAAIGVYLLARGYGASPWMSALVGAVLPLSGWALFMDGTSWINGTAITAFTPLAWWAIRRSYLKRFTPWSIVVAVVFSYLLVSVGNPYGMLTLAVVFLALAVEAFLNRRGRDIWWLVGIGFSVLLLSIVIYLPFLMTSSVGFRADSTTYNDEMLSPGLSDLIGLSMPTFKPFIKAFGLPFMTFPGMYLAWFVLPVLPWLRWKTIDSTGWRRLSSTLVFGAVFLVFVLGPTQLGMFRWPARLVPFLYLAILVVLAVVLTRGLARDHRKLRIALSAVAVAIGGWMAYADVPSIFRWHLLTIAIIVVLGGLFLWLGDVGARGFAILAGGMIVFLIPQLAVAPQNDNVAVYDLPRSRSALVEDFGERYTGLTVQVADFMAMPDRLHPDDAWQDLLAGNMYSVAGVESTTAYSGVGFSKLDNALCIHYNGSTCGEAWDALWETPEGEDERLADLLNAQTVVVENDFARGASTPDGWTRVERTDVATIYSRDEPLEFPEGRISAVGDDVTIESDRLDGVGETVELTAGDGADRTITFARLAWPGYSASVDGSSVPVTTNSVGLLEIEVPAGASGELRIAFTPPGLWIGLAAAAIGVALTAVLAVLRRRKTAAERSEA
jgi:hypothetical protein